VSAWCKLCERNNSREWRKNNPEKLGKPKLTEHEWEIRRIEAHTRKLTRTNAWRALNKDATIEYNKNYKVKYHEENRELIALRRRDSYNKRKVEDPQYKLSKSLRNRMTVAIKNSFKSGSAISDLGCTIDELKQHLESKFLPGMDWSNWTKEGWHIDHIRPLASFDLTDREQFLQACHYSNLQPLWATDNLKKGAK